MTNAERFERELKAFENWIDTKSPEQVLWIMKRCLYNVDGRLNGKFWPLFRDFFRKMVSGLEDREVIDLMSKLEHLKSDVKLAINYRGNMPVFRPEEFNHIINYNFFSEEDSE